MTRIHPLVSVATIVVTSLVLTACQANLNLGIPTPSGSTTPAISGAGDGGSASGGSANVDVSKVTGADASGDLIDPCSLLSVDEVEAALGVAVLGVVRGAVKSDGSQICAYAMKAPGSTAAALGGFVGSVDDGGFGTLINGLGTAGGVFGVTLSAQDPDQNLGDTSGDAPPPEITITKVPLGKLGFVVSTPNGGSAVAANDTNVLLMLMDLIAGPSDSKALTTLLTTAYGRLES
jgi:hypothetical protein